MARYGLTTNWDGAAFGLGSVENASLCHGLHDCSISFITCFRKKKFTLFLGNNFMFNYFTLSVTGTFLVRSGILNSVHTFTSDPRNLYFIFLSIMIFGSLFLLLNKYRKENKLIYSNSKKRLY